MEPVEEKGLQLNDEYLSSLPGRLKKAQIVIGAIYTGIMIHVCSTHGNDIMYNMFVGSGCLLIAGTLLSLVASELEWGADGKVVMCKITYVYNRFAFFILIVIWFIILIQFLLREIMNTDTFYYSYRWKWYGSIGATIAITPINIYLYKRSMDLVSRSRSNY